MKKLRIVCLTLLILLFSSLNIPALFSYPEYVYSRSKEVDLVDICDHVYDGGTFRLTSGQIIRLADIDAPESYESGYSDSTTALKAWVLGKTVYLDIDNLYETDIYGRLVCVVYVTKGSNFINVNKALLDSEDAAVPKELSNKFAQDEKGKILYMAPKDEKIKTLTPELLAEKILGLPEPAGFINDVHVGGLLTIKS